MVCGGGDAGGDAGSGAGGGEWLFQLLGPSLSCRSRPGCQTLLQPSSLSWSQATQVGAHVWVPFRRAQRFKPRRDHPAPAFSHIALTSIDRFCTGFTGFLVCGSRLKHFPCKPGAGSGSSEPKHKEAPNAIMVEIPKHTVPVRAPAVRKPQVLNLQNVICTAHIPAPTVKGSDRRG